MVTFAFKGVAFDVDGTLLTSENTVSERMLETCRHLADAGIWLTIASARPPRSVLQIADMIDARGPFCALNGAVIVARDGAILSRVSLPRTVSADLIARFAVDPGVSLNVYTGTEWLVPRLDPRIQEEAAIVGFGPTIVSDFSQVGDVEKILLITDERTASSLVEELGAQPESMEVARSKPGYVEVSPPGMEKGQGLEIAARYAGLPLADLVACGDGENDIPMLANSGYGISLGHAPPGLQAVARQIVGSNDDDSLAEALMTLFRQGS